jgi:DNA-binding MarR family transcriptional regulator
MWTSKNRARYDRSKLRYPSDLTDEEWRVIEVHLRMLPITIDIRDHLRQEKTGNLPSALPAVER